MQVTYKVGEEIGKRLKATIFDDPKVTRNGTFDGLSVMSHYSNMVTQVIVTGYNVRTPAKKCNITLKTDEVLSTVIEGTWLKHRSDQPEAPNASILYLTREQETLEVHYFTGQDAYEWSPSDNDLEELRERLRPTSVAPPST